LISQKPKRPGSFGGAHCIDCRAAATIDVVKTAVFSDAVPRCPQCGNGVVKPDIVFFGESLPKRYFDLSETDLRKADLLLVFGTSLKVQPFASLVRSVVDECPRVLINRERVGEAVPFGSASDFQFQSSGGFVFDGPTAYRDVFLEGDVQESVLKLAELCGWKADLQALMDAWESSNAATVAPVGAGAPTAAASASEVTVPTATVSVPASVPVPVPVSTPTATPTSQQ
jgi:NAD-dependent deacetylase sirtuin 2